MSDSIHISKVNESYIHIEADRSILMELNDHFSYFMVNYQFTPAFKNHFWDGKLHIFSLRTGNLYFGLHSHVKKFCEKNNYECVYDDPLDVECAFSVDEFREMVAALKLSTMTPGGRIPIVPHDYQEHAVIHAIQAMRTLLLSPTSSGKTVCIYMLLRYYLAKTTEKILVLVPTTNLVKQMYGDFDDYSAHVAWSAEENCHTISDGGEKHTDKRVTISTWQALAVKEHLPQEIRATMTKAQIKAWNKRATYVLNDEYFAKFGTIFGDEVHGFAPDSGDGELMEIMSKLVNAKYRIGTTGTLKDAKVNSLILEGMFGEVYQTITTKEMMDQKKSAELFIQCLQLQYPEETRKSMKKKTYQEEMEFLLAHKARNHFICNLAVSLRGNTLVLFERVEKHGDVLRDLIAERIAADRKLFYVWGGVSTDERNDARAVIEGLTDAVIVASYGTYSTGISVRNIDNIIFASPTKAKIRVMQSIGRGLRLSARKTTVKLYDISDDLSTWNKTRTNTNDNYSLQHYMERVGYYNEEQFNYRLTKIALEWE